MALQMRRSWIVLAILAVAGFQIGDAESLDNTTQVTTTTEEDSESSTVAITSMRMYHLDPVPRRRSMNPKPESNSTENTEEPAKNVTKDDAMLQNSRRSAINFGFDLPLFDGASSINSGNNGGNNGGNSGGNINIRETKNEEEILQWLMSLTEDKKREVMKKIGWDSCPRNRRKCGECRKKSPNQTFAEAKKAQPPSPLSAKQIQADSANAKTTERSTPSIIMRSLQESKETTLSTSMLQDVTISPSMLQDMTIQPWNLQDSTILTPKFEDSTTSVAKLEDSTTSASKFEDSTTLASKFEDSTKSASKLEDSTTSASKLEDSTTSASKFEDSTTSASKFQDSEISGSKLSDSSISASRLKNATALPLKLEETMITTTSMASTTLRKVLKSFAKKDKSKCRRKKKSGKKIEVEN